MKRLLAGGLVVALAAVASPAAAYNRFQSDCPDGGAAWDFTTPVQVDIATDSFFDYLASKGITGFEASLMLIPFLADIDAVVQEYNSAHQTFIQLELGDLLTGDVDLASVKNDNSYDDHSIVIGFTSNLGNKIAAGGTDPDLGGCTYVEAHVRFKKTVDWVFGPPEDLGVTAVGFPDGVSFRAVLLHEMGHALGLAHADDTLGVMAYGVDAWTRGPNESARVELFPDDILGLQVTYADPSAPNGLDLSLSNTWYVPASEVDGDEAVQVNNCTVSRRFDTYADVDAGAVPCGVDPAPPLVVPVGGYRFCAGDDVQVRYTLNNRSASTLATEEQLWFSLDQDLEVNGAAMDLQSPDTRSFVIGPMRSAILGRVFRIPAGTPNGTYHVYARVVPMSGSGLDLWSLDPDVWNNSIPLFGTVVVDAAACP